MPTTLLLAHPDLKTQRQLCCKKSYVSFVNVSERGTDYARHTTTSPQSHIQNAIYTLFHPIQTKGADYAHHNTMCLVWLKFKIAPCVLLVFKSKL